MSEHLHDIKNALDRAIASLIAERDALPLNDYSREFPDNDARLLTAARDALRILENKGMEEAHMAGQADAGVDPSWSNAQAWVRDYLAAKELQQLSPTPE